MKHTVRPTRAQKKLMREWGLVPENWLIERDTPREMVVVHRVSEQTKTIPKKGGVIRLYVHRSHAHRENLR